MDSLENRVNIFLIGSRKSGTTSLANFLDSHTEISLSTIKESNYWDGKAIEKVDSIESYHNLFNWNTLYQVDASTSYSTYPICSADIPQKLHKYNPEAKLIYLVRNPIDRIVSHYNMSYERGDLKGTLNEAIIHHPLLLACSKYYSQIKRFIDVYPIPQILIIDNDKLNSLETQRKLKSFIGLQNHFDAIISNDNAAGSDYRMPRGFDIVLNNKLYSIVKTLLPQSTIKYVKSKFFDSINEAKDSTLNEESLSFLRKELYSEIDQLQTIVDFDITSWKNF